MVNQRVTKMERLTLAVLFCAVLPLWIAAVAVISLAVTKQVILPSRQHTLDDARLVHELRRFHEEQDIEPLERDRQMWLDQLDKKRRGEQ